MTEPVPQSAPPVQRSFTRAAGDAAMATVGTLLTIPFAVMAHGIEGTPNRIACGVTAAWIAASSIKWGVSAYRAVRPTANQSQALPEVNAP